MDYASARWLDASLPPAERARLLDAAMTHAEQAGQLIHDLDSKPIDSLAERRATVSEV